MFSFKTTETDEEKLVDFEKWENIASFILSDPYKVLNELQFMVRNQVTQRSMLIKGMFDKVKALAEDPGHM
jgi:hypothetical protein